MDLALTIHGRTAPHNVGSSGFSYNFISSPYHATSPPQFLFFIFSNNSSKIQPVYMQVKNYITKEFLISTTQEFTEFLCRVPKQNTPNIHTFTNPIRGEMSCLITCRLGRRRGWWQVTLLQRHMGPSCRTIHNLRDTNVSGNGTQTFGVNLGHVR